MLKTVQILGFKARYLRISNYSISNDNHEVSYVNRKI